MLAHAVRSNHPFEVTPTTIGTISNVSLAIPRGCRYDDGGERGKTTSRFSLISFILQQKLQFFGGDNEGIPPCVYTCKIGSRFKIGL